MMPLTEFDQRHAFMGRNNGLLAGNHVAFLVKDEWVKESEIHYGTVVSMNVGDGRTISLMVDTLLPRTRIVRVLGRRCYPCTIVEWAQGCNKHYQTHGISIIVLNNERWYLPC